MLFNVRLRNRLSYLIFIVICCTQLCLATTGQEMGIPTKRVSLTVKNASLGAVLKKLAKASGITIFFNNEELAIFDNVSMDVKNTPFSDVMHQLLDSRGLTVSVINESTVGVAKKATPATLPPASSLSSPDTLISVSGKVINEDGAPIISANVSVNGTRRGTTTGNDGSFMLKDVPRSASLTISSVSFLTQHMLINGRSDLGTILMKEYVSDLDETVIKGYYNTTKRLNSGTVITIKGEDIAKQPLTNPLLAIQARVPNLIITPSSGIQNGPVTLQLRGQNSLATIDGSTRIQTAPLIIIDGIPFDNTLNAGAFASFGTVGQRISALSMINPNDIQQIDVLADAEATSIYGSRGGNGVILVTTKRGVAGAASVNISVSSGFSEMPSKLKLLSTKEYLQIRKEAYLNDGLSIPDKSIVEKDYSNYDLTVWDTTKYTDWQKKFLGGVAPSTIANVSISGGTPLMQYLISGNYTFSKFLFPGSNKYETGGATLSLTTNSPNGKFRTSIGASYSFNQSLSPSGDFTKLAVTLAPNAPDIYLSSGELNWEPDIQTPTNSGTWQNPYAKLSINTTSNVKNLRGNANVSYELLPHLILKTSIGYSEINGRNLSLVPLASYDPTNVDAISSASYNNYLTKSLTFDPQIAYSSFIGRGKLDAFVSAAYQSQSNLSQTTVGSGFTSDALLKSLNYASQTFALITSSEYKYLAISSRLAYNLQDKYLINLAGRRDGSSRFGPGYQFGNFWSVGGAYIFSQEELIKSTLPFLSFGKLRMSYGTSGNDGIGDYRYIELYEGISNRTYQDLILIRSRGVTNPDFHWESVKKLEIAIEAGVADDRVLLTVSKWRTRASDQLGNLPLPSTGGGINIPSNQDAKIQNSGWDFIINSKNIASKNFSWNTTVTFGIQNNKLLSNPQSLYNNYGLDRFVEVGKPFSGYVVTYESKGVNPLTGLYQFVDNAGNVSTDNSKYDARKITTIPKTLGLSNNFAYKTLSIDFFIQFTKQYGRNYLFDEAFTNYDNLNYGAFSSVPGGEFGNLPVEILNRWRQSGDITNIPRVTTTRFEEPIRSQYEKARGSDLAWVDASFIRLRNVSLSYTLSENINRKFRIKNFRLFIQAQNLLTITNYQGLDPETQDVKVLPLLRSFLGGIQIGL